MKIGIFGGTFNPPHNTHVSLARQAKAQLGLDRLIVMPCGLPPHKPCEVDSATRLSLTRLAFADFAEVSDFEITKQGASYTVETLRHIHAQNPDAQLFLIIGGDSFTQFTDWYRPDEIATLAILAVAARAHKTFARTANRISRATGAKAVYLDVTPNDVSSTEIRLRYDLGLDNSALVPPAVDTEIHRRGLYAQHLPMAQKLRTYLTEQRFNHTFYVVKRGLQLATPDEYEKVFVACLLHDCAKYIHPQNYADYGFSPPDDMPEPVIHSFLGAAVASRDFGITDPQILDAITYHTTGRPNMTRLEKIVYVADKTEQTRPYPLSHLLKGSLDANFKACLVEANQYTTARHCGKLYPLTQQALDYYSSN